MMSWIRPRVALFVTVASALGLACAKPPRPEEAPRPIVQAPDTARVPLIPVDVSPPTPAWSETVDFLALREAYGARKDFSARCEDREVSEKASRALVEDRFAEVIEITEPALRRCPVWAQLHLWRGAALISLGRQEEGQIHGRWFRGITQSILDSGDGKAPQTAYVTISIGEENAVLARLGLRKTGQALIQAPAMMDLVTASDESGNEVDIVFNPLWHFLRLSQEVRGLE